MTAATRQFDVIVLGAGAAGLMCAAVAGQRGRRVALLEHNGQVEDSYLRGRAVQFYESALRAGELYLGQFAFCEVGAGAL
jgi:flavin-dependent dehydrogenase